MNVSFSGDPCRIMKIAGSRTYIADDKDGDGIFETIIRQQKKAAWMLAMLSVVNFSSLPETKFRRMLSMRYLTTP